jgi:hypothetical protein
MSPGVLSIPLAVVLSTAASAAVAAQPMVSFRNDMPGSFRLERVEVWIDGALRYDGTRPVDAALPPGPHVVKVEADYRLHNPVLTYLDGVHVRLEASHSVAPGAGTVAHAVETGSVTTPIDRRAKILWR